MTRSPNAERDKRIIELHKGGWTVPQIAREVPLSPGRIQNILRDAGRTRFDRGGQKATSKRDEDRAKVQEWQEEGVPEREMARRLKKSRTYVKVLCREISGRTRTPSSERDKEIVRLFIEEGLDQIRIGKRFGISHSRVSQIIRSAGYTREDQRKAADGWVPDDEIQRLYEDEGLSQRALAKKLGMSKSGVRSRLLAMGVSLRTRAEGEQEKAERLKRRNEQIMAQYQSGESIEDLAAEYDRSPERIKQIISASTGLRPTG